ncbi:MAG: hypothetical protein JSU96_03275 [Acidobacteriota bacterium]|nr:MAG: hypothetical protein JSU96_03275 [Acidobacteriota bacterium]
MSPKNLLVRISMIFVFAVAAYGPRDGTAEAAAGLDPCGGSDHPCTLAEVTAEIREATDSLALEVVERLSLGGELDDVMEWLGARPEVAHVAKGSEGMRFRVRGGRGHWILLQTAGTVGTLSTPTLPFPGQAPTSSNPAPAATQNLPSRQQKRALLVSPFRWQWQIEERSGSRGGRGVRYNTDGIGLVAKALRARDYAEVTIMAEGLDPANPGVTNGAVGLQAFTTWDDYDYVHLLTHGASVCEDVRGDGSEVCMSALLAPWTEDYVRAQADRAAADGDAELTRLLNLVGVETGSFWVRARPVEIPEVRRGGTARKDPGTPAWERAKPADQRLPYTLTGRFIMLSPAFFDGIYPDGVSNAVVVLSACSSGHTANLAGAIRGENSAIISWKETMSLGAAAAAGELIAKTLVEVDERVEDDSGLTVEQAMDRVRERLNELTQDPPDPESCADPPDRDSAARCAMANYGSVLTVINDELADPVTGASLVIYGERDIRAREIVYLVDEEGDELENGATVQVFGTSGDGRPDSVDLRLRVDGLGMEDEPSETPLELVFEGRTIEVEQRLEAEVAPGVWELPYRMPLGRDHQDGELIDVEVVARLGDEGDSRWLYEDLRLGGCFWTAELAGLRSGDLGGPGVKVQSTPFTNGVQLYATPSDGRTYGPNDPSGVTFSFQGEPEVGSFPLGQQAFITLFGGGNLVLSYSQTGTLRLTTVDRDAGELTVVAGDFEVTFPGVVRYPEQEGPLVNEEGVVEVSGKFLWRPTCAEPPAIEPHQYLESGM